MRPGQAAPVFAPQNQILLNEDWDASMRPGQAAPVFAGFGFLFRREPVASMRPGQAAPVFSSPETGSS